MAVMWSPPPPPAVAAQDEDGVVRAVVGVETCVLLTTLLLVVRFLLDFLGPWHTDQSMLAFVVPAIESLNHAMMQFSMGLMQSMQLSEVSAPVNDYFQVWGVLLVTLQSSVKVGRPYSMSKRATLQDIMSSLWSANLLYVQLATYPLIKILLWMMWAINAARIFSYFTCTDKAVAIHHDNLRLTADYMSYEHKLVVGGADAAGDTRAFGPGGEGGSLFTMDSYNYLVHGESQVLKDLQKTTTTTSQTRRFGIRLDPGAHAKLVTLHKVWNLDGGKSGLLGDTADEGNRLKDVCLSFALYKLQLRRFYDLPVHEARQALQAGNKMRRLVSEYILHDAERAFRVVATEVSFLQDFFYSKHATMFADGFPAKNLVISLLLVAATGYIAYPVRNIPENMGIDYHTHGVFITRLMIALIVVKEFAEVHMYVFSQWAKVLALCSYATHRCLRRHPLLEGAMRALLLLVMTRDRWDEKIRQHNLFISIRAVKVKLPLPTAAGLFSFTFTSHLWSTYPGRIKMKACTKEAICESVKGLLADSVKKPRRTRKLLAGSSYLSNVLGPQLLWALELEADTHRILVWHIATALCEIDLASDTAVALRPFFMGPRPFVKKPKHGDNGARWWEHYETAASLSNYCAYLVLKELVPDNGLISAQVLNEVCQEIIQVTMDGSIGFRSMQAIFNRLMQAGTTTANMMADEEPCSITNSLSSKGAKLAKQLMEEYKEDRAGLWKKLAQFWTRFLLHLAASTRASKHKRALAGRRELITHIWALLSHAGYVSWTDHGQTPMELADRAILKFANQP